MFAKIVLNTFRNATKSAAVDTARATLVTGLALGGYCAFDKISSNTNAFFKSQPEKRTTPDEALKLQLTNGM